MCFYVVKTEITCSKFPKQYFLKAFSSSQIYYALKDHLLWIVEILLFSCRWGHAVVKKGTLKSCLLTVHLSSAHLSPWWWYPLWRTKEEMWKPVGQYTQPNPPVTQQDGEGPGFYSHLGQVKWLDRVDVESFSYTFNQCKGVKKKKSKHFHISYLLFHLYSFWYCHIAKCFNYEKSTHARSSEKWNYFLRKKIRILVILISDLNLQV